MVQGPGIRLDIRGPRPVAPPYSLLNTPGIVVDRDEGRWLNGVNVELGPCEPPDVWDPCSEGTFREKADALEFPESPQFDPFVIYSTLTCSTIGGRDLEELAREHIEASESWAVERVLADGIAGMVNPFFNDGGATPATGNDVENLAATMAQGGRAWQLHLAPSVVVVQSAQGGRLERRDDGLYEMNGMRVISGTGYQGAGGKDPQVPGDQISYAVFGVEVRMGPLVVTDIRSSLDRSNNEVTVRAERMVLATFDTCLYVTGESD